MAQGPYPDVTRADVVRGDPDSGTPIYPPGAPAKPATQTDTGRLRVDVEERLASSIDGLILEVQKLRQLLGLIHGVHL